MLRTGPSPEMPPIEEIRNHIEAQLSREHCEVVRQIRAIRKAIGPIAKDTGTMLRELDESGVSDAG